MLTGVKERCDEMDLTPLGKWKILQFSERRGY